MTISTGNCRFDHIYWINPWWKASFFSTVLPKCRHHLSCNTFLHCFLYLVFVQCNEHIIIIIIAHYNREYNHTLWNILKLKYQALRKECSYLKFFWSVFYHIRTEYGYLQSKPSYLVKFRKTRTRKNTNTDTFHAMKNSIKHWAKLKCEYSPLSE